MKSFLLLATILASFSAHAVMETHVYSIILKDAQGKNKEACGSSGELEITTSDRLFLEAKFILFTNNGSSDVLKFDLRNGNFKTIKDTKLTYGGGINGQADNLTHSLKRSANEFIEENGLFSVKTEIAENQISNVDVNNPNPKLGKFIYTEKTLDKVDLSVLINSSNEDEISIYKDSISKNYSDLLSFTEKFNYQCIYAVTRNL